MTGTRGEPPRRQPTRCCHDDDAGRAEDAAPAGTGPARGPHRGAPLVTDFYLPALPDLARSLGTNEAAAQLTISVSVVGLALGQLVAGPLSDRVGRLLPLRVGVLLLAVTSFLCAIADDIGTLLALRLAQGLAGAATLVVARAVVRDVYDGARAARIFSELMLVMGLAPVVGPLVGGQLLRVTDWRGIFVALGILSALLLVATLLVLEETGQRRAAGSPNGFALCWPTVTSRVPADIRLSGRGPLQLHLDELVRAARGLRRRTGGVLLDLRCERRRDDRGRAGQRATRRSARASPDAAGRPRPGGGRGVWPRPRAGVSAPLGVGCWSLCGSCSAVSA